MSSCFDWSHNNTSAECGVWREHCTTLSPLALKISVFPTKQTISKSYSFYKTFTKQNFTRSCFVLWYCVFGFSAPHSSTTGARVWSSSLKYLASRNYLKLCFTILDNNSWSLQWFNFSIICQLVEINVGWTIIYFHSFCKCFKLLEQIYIISFEYVFILLFKFGSINTNTQHNFYTLKVILVLEGEFRFNGYCSYGELNWTFSMKLQWEILQQGPRKLSPPGSQN